MKKILLGLSLLVTQMTPVFSMEETPPQKQMSLEERVAKLERTVKNQTIFLQAIHKELISALAYQAEQQMRNDTTPLTEEQRRNEL